MLFQRPKSQPDVAILSDTKDNSGESATKKIKLSSSSASSSSSQQALVYKPAVFIVPKRLALRQDPSQCGEILGELYNNYYTLEVPHSASPPFASTAVES